MSKIEMIEIWLDSQEQYHKKGTNITAKMYADAMKQVKTMITTKGWEETLKYITEFYIKGRNSEMVGPVALANAYHKIMQKMKSINMKEEKKRRLALQS